ncbi:hypothetical protein PVAP13_2KG375761 [Panicum virgatum]|uniref:Uncharacterized protein n=1 Tax=Panicum virgatum TaxID=38727 RepID=A0A8T0W5U5_PANVG|nr:hypothetical protein PVAP13_2KG375761 [Panicum virgatum]
MRTSPYELGAGAAGSGGVFHRWSRRSGLTMACADLCEGNNYVLLIFIEAVENIKKEFFRLPYIRIASNSIKHYWNANWLCFEEKGV